jgi:hypothetical protein
MMAKNVSDRLFAERALARLPVEPLPPLLEAALMAGYDAWRAERDKGAWAAFKTGLRDFRQTIWPGAPAWAPAVAFAASLLVGAMLGIFLSPMSEMEPQAFSLEHTQDFSLLSEAGQEDL